MHKRIFLLAALALLPLLTRAQTDLTTGQIDLSGGLLLRPDGAGAGLNAYYRTGPRWRLGLQVSYYQYKFDVINTLPPASIVTTGQQRLFLLPTVTYDFLRRERWRIYTGLSVGVVLSSNGSSAKWSNHFSSAFHLGAEHQITSRLFVFLQLSGVVQPKINDLSNERVFGTGSFIQGSIGIGYRFGR